MKDYFSHAAYSRWYRQYQITLNQIRSQFDSLRLSVETTPLPEQAHLLLEEEVDEIDIQIENLIPRNYMPEGNPLETREVFVENFKVIANFILRLFRRPFSFESIYEKEKRSVLQKYKHSNIKGKLSNLRRHIDEAVIAQMKAFIEPPLSPSSSSTQQSESELEPELELENRKEASGR